MKKLIVLAALLAVLGGMVAMTGCAAGGPAVYGVPNESHYNNFNAVDIYMYGYPRHKVVLIPKKGSGTLRFNYSLSYLIRERVAIRYRDGEIENFDYQQDKRY